MHPYFVIIVSAALSLIGAYLLSACRAGLLDIHVVLCVAAAMMFLATLIGGVMLIITGECNDLFLHRE